jgi:hypothetical protein
MLELSFWNDARLDREISRLTSLLDDLKTIRRDGAPSPEALNMGPTLEGWNLSTRPVPCLAGVYLNHPKIPNGYIGITSELLVINVELGFARTRSRVYRLGEPAPSTDVK